MVTGLPTALAFAPDELGEGLAWIAPELWRVDILGQVVYRAVDPLGSDPTVSAERFPGEVGFALPRRDGGMVVGCERQLWLLSPDGERSLLLELDEPEQNRFNDAICDASGRLWAGTFARDRRTGAASLYRVDPDGSIERVLDGLTISNGLDWLDDGATLHFVDSPTQRVDVLDVNRDAGRLSDRRPLATVDAEHGAPDGLCVDADDGTWVALFGGAAVRRYARDGELTETLELPVPHVTNVCIGADGLFVTSTRHRLSHAALSALPLAGCVFHASAAVTARPPHAFAG